MILAFTALQELVEPIFLWNPRGTGVPQKAVLSNSCIAIDSGFRIAKPLLSQVSSPHVLTIPLPNREINLDYIQSHQAGIFHGSLFTI
jgi:hypothetical protein